MSVYQTASCDVCGIQKKESNNWWLTSVDENGVFTCESFNIDNYESCNNDKIVCGREHAHKILDQYLDSREVSHNQPKVEVSAAGAAK